MPADTGTDRPSQAATPAVASIEGQALHEFRAKRTFQSIRALGSSLPVLVVSLLDWTPPLTLLVLISGGVALATAWASVRAIQDLALPLRERYAIVDDALVREVGERAQARIPRAKMRTMMLDPIGFVGAGGGQQIFIPRAAEGFDALVDVLQRWGPVITRAAVVAETRQRLRLSGMIRAALIGVALVYFVISTGEWVWLVIGVMIGLSLAELLARGLVGRSKRELAGGV